VEVYHGIESFVKRDKAVVTTGTFDGVHIGHQTILERLIEVAKKNNGESVLLTFYPHPRMVLNPDSDLQLINTIEEKIDLLKKVGIEHLIIHPFSKEFSRYSSIEFVRDILVNKIGTKKLVIGYDHHFGRNREGSFEHLKEFGPLYGFDVEEIPVQEVSDVNVSSTKVRQALLDGDVVTANKYLGHEFSLTGKIIRGQQIGRTIGFPTANLDLNNKYKIIPALGVYAVKVLIAGICYDGMMNIGTRPSVDSKNNKVSLEVNIFNFDANLYGECIVVKLIQRIRDEKKFDSKEILIKEIKKDKIKVKNILQ
jgi:riboflavin kinase/FMN adenylyltransferase